MTIGLLEFLHFSGVSGSNHLGRSGVNAQGRDEFGVLSDFLAKQSDQIQTRRAFGFASPLGEGSVGFPTPWAEYLQSARSRAL